MNKPSFITEDFLLENHFPRTLYENYSKDLPIIDYPNLSPKDIAEDKQYWNIIELWLAGKHAKYRLMGAYGVKESYLSGQVSNREKFMAWAKTVPYTIRNTIYNRTQLEQPSNSCRDLLNKMNVESLCTTEDPDISYFNANEYFNF